MSTHDLILQTFAREFEKAYSQVSLGTNFIFCEPYCLIISPNRIFEYYVENYTVLNVKISVQPPDRPELIITTLATSAATTIEDAVAQVVFEWFNCVFPVLRCCFTSHPTIESDITPSSMLIRDDDTGEMFGWHIYPGSTKIHYVNSTTLTISSETELLAAVWHEIPNISLHDSPFWLEMSLARGSNGEIIAICRVNDQFWEAGIQALRRQAKSSSSLHAINSVRKYQFVLFIPTEPAQLNHYVGIA